MPLGNSHRLSRGHVFEPALDRRFGARGNRHQPLLVTLARGDEERLALPHRAARQAHQLARAEPRAIEQFEEGEVAHRRRLAARRPVLRRLEHARDLVLVEDARQRPLEARPGQRGRRVVAAEASSTRKPKKRRSAADRRATVAGDRSAQLTPSRESSSADACPSAPTILGGALEVIAIGGEGVARRPGFGGHHVEKPVDQRLIVGAHVREASAAIIRAVKSCPVRSSAATTW